MTRPLKNMQKKKITVLAMVMMLSVYAVPMPVMAAVRTYETEVTNNIEIGDVNIKIAEYERNSLGQEVPFKDNKIVLPGENVEDIIRITNLANTSWIRIKMECSSTDGIDGFTDDMIAPDTNDWVKRGDYWYYLKPLKHDKSVDFIKGIQIPEKWGTEYAGSSFSITIRSDAVQTANFTPDFDAEDPWFGTVIEACAHTVYEKKEKAGGSFTVAFEGGAEGLVKTGDDFFSNWSQLMPGDTVQDSVQLKNNYARPVTLYFRTENEADNILLEALMIQIKCGDNVIYDGPMDKTAKENVLLAKLQTGEALTLSYTLTVPASLTNRYALSDARTTWIFKAEIETPGSSGGGGGSGRPAGSVTGDYVNSGPGVKNPDATAPTNPTDPGKTVQNPVNDTINKIGDTVKKYVPKLGDDDTERTALAITGISFLGIIFLAVKKKKKKGEKGEDDDKA